MQKPVPKPDEIIEVPIVKKLEPIQEARITVNIPKIILGLVIIGFGIFTGFVLSQPQKNTATGGGSESGSTDNREVKQFVGRKDEKNFPDTAEGVMKEGGQDGEGTHHLERPGGPSQYVYLTSSVVPLDDYLDKQVRVCGQTVQAEKVGWLMDVGCLELLE